MYCNNIWNNHSLRIGSGQTLGIWQQQQYSLVIASISVYTQINIKFVIARGSWPSYLASPALHRICGVPHVQLHWWLYVSSGNIIQQHAWLQLWKWDSRELCTNHNLCIITSNGHEAWLTQNCQYNNTCLLLHRSN